MLSYEAFCAKLNCEIETCELLQSTDIRCHVRLSHNRRKREAEYAANAEAKAAPSLDVILEKLQTRVVSLLTLFIAMRSHDGSDGNTRPD